MPPRQKRRATTAEDNEKLEAEVRKLNGHRGFLGDSLIEIIWQDMDRLVNMIMDEPMNDQERELSKAQALGLSYAIAVIQNPYTARLARDAAIDGVRRQAMERYHAAD